MKEGIEYNDNVGGVSVGKKDGQTIVSSDTSDGGMFVGKSHSEDGGIKTVNKETGEPLLVEGGEVIVNKRALSLEDKFVCEGTPREITSKVNEMEGGVSWSETGSCRLVKKAADGTEIGEDVYRANEGIAVQYIKNGKLNIVTADTKDQAEIIHQAIDEYREGFISKSELENTLQSYMGDEYLLDDPSHVEVIGGVKHIHSKYYDGWIPFYNEEPINLDYKTAVAGDGSEIQVNIKIDKVKDGVWNFHYQDSYGIQASGMVNENEKTGELDYIIEDTYGSFNADADKETCMGIYGALDEKFKNYSNKAAFGKNVPVAHTAGLDLSKGETRGKISELVKQWEDYRLEYRHGMITGDEYQKYKDELVIKYKPYITQAEIYGLPILMPYKYRAERGMDTTPTPPEPVQSTEQSITRSFEPDAENYRVSSSDPDYPAWEGSVRDIIQYIEDSKDAIENYNPQDPWMENLDKLGLVYGPVQTKDEAGGGKSILRSTDMAKRPSPSVSATIYPEGYRMEGNDGNMWVIATDSRGVHRWKKDAKAEDGVELSAQVEKYVSHYMNDDMSVIFDKIGMDMPVELEGDEYEQIMDEAREKAIEYFTKHPEQMTNKFGDPFKFGNGGGIDAGLLTEEERFELNTLQGLSGFNNGQSLNGLLESMGLSNYRFSKYASETEKNKVEKSLNSLVKKGFVNESGLGYKITQTGADYLRSFNYGTYNNGGGVGVSRANNGTKGKHVWVQESNGVTTGVFEQKSFEEIFNEVKADKTFNLVRDENGLKVFVRPADEHRITFRLKAIWADGGGVGEKEYWWQKEEKAGKVLFLELFESDQDNKTQKWTWFPGGRPGKPFGLNFNLDFEAEREESDRIVGGYELPEYETTHEYVLYPSGISNVEFYDFEKDDYVKVDEQTEKKYRDQLEAIVRKFLFGKNWDDIIYDVKSVYLFPNEIEVAMQIGAETEPGKAADGKFVKAKVIGGDQYYTFGQDDGEKALYNETELSLFDQGYRMEPELELRAVRNSKEKLEEYLAEIKQKHPEAFLVFSNNEFGGNWRIYIKGTAANGTIVASSCGCSHAADGKNLDTVVLKSKLTSGKGEEYRVVLVKKDDPYKSVIRPEKYSQKMEEWISTGPGWALGTLLGIEGYYGNGRAGDKLYIDMGQNWYVTGMSAVLDEAEEMVGEKAANGTEVSQVSGKKFKNYASSDEAYEIWLEANDNFLKEKYDEYTRNAEIDGTPDDAVMGFETWARDMYEAVYSISAKGKKISSVDADEFYSALKKGAGWYCMDNASDKKKFIKWLEANCEKFGLNSTKAVLIISKNDSWCTDNDEDMGWFLNKAFGLETKEYKEALAEGYYKESGFAADGYAIEETIIDLGQMIDGRIYSKYMRLPKDKRNELDDTVRKVRNKMKSLEREGGEEEDLKRSKAYKELVSKLGIEEAADGKNISNEKIKVAFYKWGEYQEDQEIDLIDLPETQLNSDQLAGFNIRPEDEGKFFYASDLDIDEDDDGVSVKRSFATDKAYPPKHRNGGMAAQGKKLPSGELWFSPTGEGVKTEPTGTAIHLIEKKLAQMMGAQRMERVGEDEHTYTYVLHGNPMMIAAKTSILEEEKGLDVETWGSQKRVRIPKMVLDQEVYVRYPLLTPFKHGGGVGRTYVSKEGIKYWAGTDERGIWTVFSQGTKQPYIWEKRNEFDSGLASKEDAVHLAKSFAGVIEEKDPEAYFMAHEYGNGGFVSKGEKVWNELNSSKRAEFLYENFTPEITPRSQEILVGKAYNFLPKNVKIKIESKYANVEQYAGGGGVGKTDNTIIDFVKALEESGIAAKDSHKNEQFISTVKAIISLPKKDIKDSNPKVRMIYSEYNDWIQTYSKAADGRDIAEIKTAIKNKGAMRLFKQLEANNDHTTALVVIAHAVGNESDIREAEAISREYDRTGHQGISRELYARSIELQGKLWKRFKEYAENIEGVKYSELKVRATNYARDGKSVDAPKAKLGREDINWINGIENQDIDIDILWLFYDKYDNEADADADRKKLNDEGFGTGLHFRNGQYWLFFQVRYSDYEHIAAADGKSLGYKDIDKDIVGRVMHEFKVGELHDSHGNLVTDRKQAIAIALSMGRRHKN